MPKEKVSRIDNLADLVQAESIDGRRLGEYLHGLIKGGPVMVPLCRVRDYVPVSRHTLLRWERAGNIRIYRPNTRRAFVPLESLLKQWESCGGGA